MQISSNSEKASALLGAAPVYTALGEPFPISFDVLPHKVKSSPAWRDAQWLRWPRMEDWPEFLDTYEAAAFLRVSYDFVNSRLVKDRSGKSALAHHEFGRVKRVRKSDLLKFAFVAGRN